MASQREDHLPAFVLACALAAACNDTNEKAARSDVDASGDILGTADHADGAGIDASHDDVSIEGGIRDGAVERARSHGSPMGSG